MTPRGVVILERILKIRKKVHEMITMNRPNKAHLHIMFHRVQLTVIDPRLRRQFVAVRQAFHSHWLLVEPFLARQWLRCFFSCVDYGMVAGVDAWLFAALAPICENGPRGN